MITVVISILGGCCFLIILGFGLARLPFFVVVSWWFSWLLVSSLSITGVFVPKINTYCPYLGMMLSVLSGGLIYVVCRQLRKQGASFPQYSRSVLVLSMVEKRTRLLSIVGWSVLLPVEMFFFFRAARVFVSSDALAGYREAAFGLVEGNVSIIYGPPSIRLLYTLLIKPTSFFLFLIGATLFLIRHRVKLFLLGSLLLILDAITMLGRFAFYQILVFVLLVPILRRRQCHAHARNSIRFVPFAVALLIPMLFIGFIRVDERFNLSQLVEKYVVEYHTGGFTLFDQELNDPNSRLNQVKSYGRASLGILEHIPVLLSRRIDKSVDSVPIRNSIEMQKLRVIGTHKRQGRIYLNAFVTVLYPLYMDGGAPLIMFAACLYGFFLARVSYRSLRQTPDFLSAFVLLLLLYLGLFSIFQPLIDSAFWVYLIGGFLITRFTVANNSPAITNRK